MKRMPMMKEAAVDAQQSRGKNCAKKPHAE